MNGAQWVVRTLKDRGVEYVFALCGNGMSPFLDACIDYGMKIVDVRNEQAASYMADAWGRMTGKLGVVAVSSGPGYTNALTGLANSFWDGGPMLLLSGCSSQSTRGMDNFQELDQVGLAEPISKYAKIVAHVEMLQHEVNTALAMTVNGRPGPVHLTIPIDVFSAEVNEDKFLRHDLPPVEVVQHCPGDSDSIQNAAEILASAKRPFMVVGSGLFYSQAWEALAEFAKLTDIPIVSHIWDRCCIEKDIPQYMGITNDDLNYSMSMLSKADAILVAGARIDYRVGFGHSPAFAKDAKVIRVDVEPAEINRTVVPDIGIVGDPRSVLSQMTEKMRGLDNSSSDGWLAEVTAQRDALLQKWEKLGTEDVWPLPGIRVCREVNKFLDRDITFLLDGGNIGRWAHMIMFNRHPSHWFTCGASGAIGWGLPGAVSLKLARPDHPLLLLSGDGSAGFTISEIETALRFGTPFVMVIAHDGAWGIVSDGQKDGRSVASNFGEIRFDKVAQAFGAKGVFIEDPKQLGPSIEEGLAADTVTVIHVPTQLAGVGKWEKRFGC